MPGGVLRRASEAVRASRTATVLAAAGLIARAGFYLLLAHLVVRVILTDGGPPANAAGALETAASTPLGLIPVGLAALGFFVFGLSRLLGALRDRTASILSRVTTALQGLFSLGLSEVPASYVLGSRSTGSEHQQRTTTSRLLLLPAGRVILVAVGLIFIGTCAWQVNTAVRTRFTESLRTDSAAPWLRFVIRITGRVGITARALVFLPMGVLLIVAAVRVDPSKAKGLDGALSILAHNAWGRVLLGGVATGFTVFATYSLLEARYRDVDAGD